MISITGIPGAGKTTVCRELNARGIKCLGALDVPGAEACNDKGEVDTECLRVKISHSPVHIQVVEGHFSHLLGCSSVIILERDEEVVRKELVQRGYPAIKIEENIDVQRADILYQEALALTPATRIHRVKVVEGSFTKTVDACLKFMEL